LAINTYVPSDIKPRDGHAAPWEQFLRHLIPDEKDRKHFERWFMTLVSCPHAKMKYGVLLISEQQSIGKSTLGEKILRPLVGEHNVSIVSESEIVDSNFNGLTAHKRLSITHEIYQGR
jgi:hypothetical protein